MRTEFRQAKWLAGRDAMLSLAMVIAVSMPVLGWAGTQTVHKRVGIGKTLVIRLPGKPKMGYSWRINENKSGGLELISVRKLGWSFDTAPRGSGSFTKPGVLRYVVSGRAAGAATLVFEYFRKEPGSSPSAVRIYRIEVMRNSSLNLFAPGPKTLG